MRLNILQIMLTYFTNMQQVVFAASSNASVVGFTSKLFTDTRYAKSVPTQPKRLGECI